MQAGTAGTAPSQSLNGSNSTIGTPWPCPTTPTRPWLLADALRQHDELPRGLVVLHVPVGCDDCRPGRRRGRCWVDRRRPRTLGGRLAANPVTARAALHIVAVESREAWFRTGSSLSVRTPGPPTPLSEPATPHRSRHGRNEVCSESTTVRAPTSFENIVRTLGPGSRAHSPQATRPSSRSTWVDAPPQSRRRPCVAAGSWPRSRYRDRPTIDAAAIPHRGGPARRISKPPRGAPGTTPSASREPCRGQVGLGLTRPARPKPMWWRPASAGGWATTRTRHNRHRTPGPSRPSPPQRSSLPATSDRVEADTIPTHSIPSTRGKRHRRRNAPAAS